MTQTYTLPIIERPGCFQLCCAVLVSKTQTSLHYQVNVNGFKVETQSSLSLQICRSERWAVWRF